MDLHLAASRLIIHHLSKKKFGQILLIITHQENEIPQIKTPPPALEGESVPEYNKLHMRATASKFPCQ